MDVIQLISSLGFPIVACIYIAIWTNKQSENYRADIKELQLQFKEEIRQLQTEHKEEVKALKESLDNNTLVLQKLIDRMDKEGET